MKIKLHNTVVFAENYNELIKWYQEVFLFDIILKNSGTYQYTELGFDGQNIIGITPSKEVDHSPTLPKNNTTIMQLRVTDIKKLFEKVIAQKGEIIFGPSKEEDAGFYYGGIKDIEGNEIWIFDENK